ncbi:MAG: hypothetical protein ABJK20_16280 [Halieaceae bacterium]
MADFENNAGFIERRNGDPLAALADWRASAAESPSTILLVDFELPQYWLSGKPCIALTAIYCLLDGALQVSVTDLELPLEEEVPAKQYARWAQQQGLVCADAGTAIALGTEAIAKPWGQEIWYSGVEERGVCCFRQGEAATPIPWLQAAMPSAALGPAETDLVLLKILDPAARAVTGDLYFELHEEKREVYVVTHIDEAAWPDGIGAIRYGFNPEAIKAAGSEAAFREQYLAAVRDYEAVRREIDAFPEGEVPDAATISREEALRSAMNDLTALRPLRVGDVIKVPLLLPHSLQHGVRTIEFQTPVYERKILSFAQQVVTQGHWDTAEAVRQMTLLPPADSDFQRLPGPQGCEVERIVDFEDFEVWRIRLDSGAAYCPELVECYRIIIVVSGKLTLSGAIYGPEEAALIPAATHLEFSNADPAGEVVFLLATPRG